MRVSYHNGSHYNAILDPQNPAFGVGLGFGDLKPGVSCRSIFKNIYLNLFIRRPIGN